jgi:hypothetical protein
VNRCRPLSTHTHFDNGKNQCKNPSEICGRNRLLEIQHRLHINIRDDNAKHQEDDALKLVKMGEPLSAAVYTGLLLLMNADYIFAAVGLTLTIVFAIFSVRQDMIRLYLDL